MGNRSFILIMFVILFSCSFACVCHSGDLINEETNNMETKRVLEDKETKGINKYPRYFEIVKNDGTDLTVRIGEMVPDAKSYYYRLLKNGKKVVRFKNVKVDQLRARTVDILGGLSITDKVINAPNLGLLEGSKVKVVTLAKGYLQ